MNKKLMVSVLLAGMAVSFQACADNDRTPDEYNKDTIYESPLDQPLPAAVNERQDQQEMDEGDAFAKSAGQLVQGNASGRSARHENAAAVDGVEADKGLRKSVQENKAGDDSESVKKAAKQAAVKKAEEQAKETLAETDENFEPETEEKYPGYEYQARRQIKNISDETAEKAVLKEKNGIVSEKLLQKKTQLDPVSKNRPAPAVNSRKSNTDKLPTVITGDNAQYDNDSGDFIIEGKVRLTQGTTQLSSTKAVGNAKTGDIWLLEGGTLKEPTNNVQAHWAHYNYNNETGELLHIKGASKNKGEGSTKKDFYDAPHGIIEHGMLIIDQGGTTTRCPAVKHPSCLSVKAKTITIVPNDRIIARGVQVFVKGVHVYSRDVWINDLQESNNRLMPHIGWNGDKGFYLSLDYEQPIGNPLLKNPTKAYMHQVYYTKSKYKPFYGIRHDEHDFYVRLNHGFVYDSDNDAIDEGIWLHKKMDWGIFLKPHRISKKLPLTYDANITHGLWQYTHRNWSSWHTEKVVHLRHDRFYPLGGKKLYMDLMIGRKWVKESNETATGSVKKYGNNLNSNIYEGTLGYKFSDKWNIWTRYHDEHKTSYAFSLGQPDFAKEWRTGISWKPDKHNTFVVVRRHNSENGSRTHGNYSTTFVWSHRFCCEVLSVMYERKHYKEDHEWTVKFDFLNW